MPETVTVSVWPAAPWFGVTLPTLNWVIAGMGPNELADVIVTHEPAATVRFHSSAAPLSIQPLSTRSDRSPWLAISLHTVL